MTVSIGAPEGIYCLWSGHTKTLQCPDLTTVTTANQDVRTASGAAPHLQLAQGSDTELRAW